LVRKGSVRDAIAPGGGSREMTDAEYECRRGWHLAAAAWHSRMPVELQSGVDFLDEHEHRWLAIYCNHPLAKPYLHPDERNARLKKNRQ
jgi:hypothetical protein